MTIEEQVKALKLVDSAQIQLDIVRKLLVDSVQRQQVPEPPPAGVYCPGCNTELNDENKMGTMGNPNGYICPNCDFRGDL